ncbi:DNA polymerase IV [Halalkalicoccus jeotgali]|uniref:DNA polymerase IV n=1 Tax=Halalkalicoccus jeotgali (strain DSM 18796 / CECT 7217 / JCM 14584 / KCTC 4019 / B3) TaxID=795797 RepID=D8J3C0_HALJB|nr:DNA polymerase IV [Halalkalicoccus jeotgali]ADJ15227.1 DNA-directed DNA polymerase [Halalkalicoccus jeotgali B3]ELY35196.1 DNA polymerase IV [Halalkalicoccus jeotgali B3]
MGARLPGTESEARIVAHADMDCFYAACERLREPALEGEPLVVGMGYEPGTDNGAVATASYEARAFGVESAQAISAALEHLPRKRAAATDAHLDIERSGFYRPVDIPFYESVSEEVRGILHENAEVVREVSIDEAYLDVTERTTWDDAEAFARRIKDRIEQEIGVVASVGIAPNMSTAKIASDAEKPDGLVVVQPGEVRDFLAPVPVEELHGVGPVTARTLRERGIGTAGELAGADRHALLSAFGERGGDLYDRARGEDDREVTPKGRPKSLSRESAFVEPTADYEAIEERALALAAAVTERATRKDALYRTVGIKVVTPPFDVNTRARSLSGPVDDPDLVDRIVRDLLSEFEGERIRKIGVRVSNLEFGAAAQSSLDGWVGGDGVAGGSGEDDSDPVDSAARRGQASLSEFE